MDWDLFVTLNTPLSPKHLSSDFIAARDKEVRLWHSMCDRKLLGRNWSWSKHRTLFIAFPEYGPRHSMAHWHLILRSARNPKFENPSELYKSVWKDKLCPDWISPSACSDVISAPRNKPTSSSELYKRVVKEEGRYRDWTPPTACSDWITMGHDNNDNKAEHARKIQDRAIRAWNADIQPCRPEHLEYAAKKLTTDYSRENYLISKGGTLAN